MTNQNAALADDECLISCYRCTFSGDTLEIEGCAPLKIKAQSENIPLPGNMIRQTIPCITLVTRDIFALTEPLLSLANKRGDSLLEPRWYYSFDVDGGADEENAAYDKLHSEIDNLIIRGEEGSYSYGLESRERERMSFYGIYGALFFIGILLSVVFVFAAVLIIYYKQISEGFEDQKRFDVMQKVGMTKAEIRRSVNSQVLTVFFLPLLLAGIHLAVAFPIIWKLLQLFMFKNLALMIGVTAANFVVFALIYALVYAITSNAYYAIVSGQKEGAAL